MITDPRDHVLEPADQNRRNTQHAYVRGSLILDGVVFALSSPRPLVFTCELALRQEDLVVEVRAGFFGLAGLRDRHPARPRQPVGHAQRRTSREGRAVDRYFL